MKQKIQIKAEKMIWIWGIREDLLEKVFREFDGEIIESCSISDWPTSKG